MGHVLQGAVTTVGTWLCLPYAAGAAEGLRQDRQDVTRLRRALGLAAVDIGAGSFSAPGPSWAPQGG